MRNVKASKASRDFCRGAPDTKFLSKRRAGSFSTHKDPAALKRAGLMPNAGN
jgi:hypothetical protein